MCWLGLNDDYGIVCKYNRFLEKVLIDWFVGKEDGLYSFLLKIFVVLFGFLVSLYMGCCIG